MGSFAPGYLPALLRPDNSKKDARTGPSAPATLQHDSGMARIRALVPHNTVMQPSPRLVSCLAWRCQMPPDSARCGPWL